MGLGVAIGVCCVIVLDGVDGPECGRKCGKEACMGEDWPAVVPYHPTRQLHWHCLRLAVLVRCTCVSAPMDIAGNKWEMNYA